MVALPAIAFLGLRGPAAWAAIGAAGFGGYVVATKALPSLMGPSGRSSGRSSGGGASSSPAAPTAQLLVDLTKAVSQASGQVALGALGPGVQLAGAGINLAGNVTGAIERYAETSTRALADTNAALTRVNGDQSRGILDFATRALDQRTTVAAQQVVTRPVVTVVDQRPPAPPVTTFVPVAPSLPPVAPAAAPTAAPVVAAPDFAPVTQPATVTTPRYAIDPTDNIPDTTTRTTTFTPNPGGFAVYQAGFGTGETAKGNVLIGFSPNGQAIFA